MSLVIMTLTRGQHRHCSTHHQTTTHMLRHNKTAKWMSRKRSADIASLIMFARTIGRCLRQDHCQQEQVVMLQIREKLVEDERKKNLREAKQAEVKQQILRRLIACVGPCETSDDVDVWFIVFSETKTVSCWRPWKTKSGTRRRSLEEKEVFVSQGLLKIWFWPWKNTLVTQHSCGASATASVRRWRPWWWIRWIWPCSATRKKDLVLVRMQMMQMMMMMMTELCFLSANRASGWLSFMMTNLYWPSYWSRTWTVCSCEVSWADKGQKDYYRWPRSEDVAETSAHYVYRWDFEVTPVSNDGRVWEVANIDDIASGYELINGVKTHRKLLFFGTWWFG